MNFIKYSEDPIHLKTQFLDKGYSGYVYKLNEDEVYKEFLSPFKDKNLIYRLVSLKHNSFAFPNKIVEVNEEIVGYTMNYVDGVNLDEIDINISIQELIYNIKKFERAIYEISQQFIEISDIHYDNLKYTTRGFVALDTDCYNFSSDDNTNRICKQNLSEFNLTILLYLMDYKILKDLPFGIKEKYELVVLHGMTLVSKYIEETIVSLEQLYDIPIYTIEDLVKITNPNKEIKKYGSK